MKKENKSKSSNTNAEITKNKESLPAKANNRPKYPKLNFELYCLEMNILDSTTGFCRYGGYIVETFYEYLTQNSISKISKAQRVGRNIRNYYRSYSKETEINFFEGAIPLPTDLKENLLKLNDFDISDIFAGYLLIESGSFINHIQLDFGKRISKDTFNDDYQAGILKAILSSYFDSEKTQEYEIFVLQQLILEAVLWKEFTGKDNLIFGDLIRDVAKKLSIEPDGDLIPNSDSISRKEKPYFDDFEDFDFEGNK
ncbi:hypothetical protein [Pseudomonas aeruginosa]|uniref:hypothetical protein n=1 Tax=Pseudomonas aeruginosa TaxID=287 RepID=UPI00104D1F24|nr:hypothetical protein [Pseudomonas aeruginosa]